jgi:type I restriction enzyme, S subunit
MSKKQKIPKLRFSGFMGEWEDVPLRDVFYFRQGVQCEVEKQYGQAGQGMIRFIRIIDLTSKNEEARYITDPGIEHHVRANDLFMVRYGTPGLIGFGYEGVIANNLFRIIPFEPANTSNSYFVYVFLNRNNKILELASSTTMPALNFRSLGLLKVAYPTLPEQQKIAHFLTAIDEKINQLTRQKALLEQYKKGVMQQIFSRGLRFRDGEGRAFGEWEVKRLGEVAKFSKGAGISKIDITEDGINECIRYGELYTHYSEVIQQIKSKTNLEKSELVLSQYNDVIIPASGETQMDIAKASCVLKAGVALGGDLNIIRTKLNGVFLAYYLNNAKKHDIARLSQGISVVHLYSSQLAQLELELPTLPEQQKIADFLTALDEKISRVAGQVESVKGYKKGLLQGLFV